MRALPDDAAPGPLADLLRAWNEWRAGRLMPARTAIDPVRMPGLVGSVSILDVARGDARYWYRLHGHRQVELLGQELTNKPAIAMAHDELREQLLVHLDETVSKRRPLIFQETVKSAADAPSYRRLVLPLSSDGKTVDMLLTSVLPANARHRRRADWDLAPSGLDPFKL